MISHLLIGAVFSAHAYGPGHFGHTQPAEFSVEGMALLHDKKFIVPLENDFDFATKLVRICHVHDAHAPMQDGDRLFWQNENGIRVKEQIPDRAAGELERTHHEILTLNLE
jgi:hypothetical protein